jgi:hypothetical protein
LIDERRDDVQMRDHEDLTRLGMAVAGRHATLEQTTIAFVERRADQRRELGNKGLGGGQAVERCVRLATAQISNRAKKLGRSTCWSTSNRTAPGLASASEARSSREAPRRKGTRARVRQGRARCAAGS